MKAISLWQPWASLVAIGAKTIETRSWWTGYRGPIAIHAAKTKAYLRVLADEPRMFSAFKNSAKHAWWVSYRDAAFDLPFGSIVAVATLTDCRSIECLNRGGLSLDDRAFGDFSPGRFAWFLSSITPLAKPVACIGRQGLFNIKEIR